MGPLQACRVQETTRCGDVYLYRYKMLYGYNDS